jgi:hypothetical protein
MPATTLRAFSHQVATILLQSISISCTGMGLFLAAEIMSLRIAFYPEAVANDIEKI